MASQAWSWRSPFSQALVQQQELARAGLSCLQQQKMWRLGSPRRAPRHGSHGHLAGGVTKAPAPRLFHGCKTGAVHTMWVADKLVNIQNDASKQGDLLEQLPFFSNTTVASQLLLSSISVLFAKPFTIFAEFFVFLSKQWCMVELYLQKWNKL